MDSSSARQQVGSLPFALGIEQALRLFEILLPDVYQTQCRILERITISEDNASWDLRIRDCGGDAIDLYIQFAGDKAAELITRINELLPKLTLDDQQALKPEGLVPDSATADPPFPLNALPAVLQDASQSLAEVHGVPPEFPAAVAMAVVGAAVGRGLRLNTVRGMTTYANLYVLVGMRSGLGKSTVMKPLCAPFFTYERYLQAQHATRLPRIEAELAMVRKEIAKIIQKGSANGISQPSNH